MDMPLEFGGTVFLNANEASEYLQMSYVTFKKYRESYGLKSYDIPGKGNSKFYKEEDLKALREARPSSQEA